MSSSAIKLGPLTTTFTPPPECSTAFLYYDSVMGVNGYWGESCVSDDVKAAAETGVYASSCYPEGWAGPFSINYRGHPDQLAVFSPGLHCPRGWASACSVERRSEDDGPTDTQSAMWSVLKDGETGIGCCPSGYSCATLSDLDYQCIKTMSAGEKISGGSISGDECDVQQVTITIEDKFMNKDLYAPQLNLIHSSSKEATTPGSEGGSDGGRQDSGADTGSGGGDLSQSATIAIGVSIPLFVIALGIAIFFFLRRRKRALSPQEVMVPNDPTMKPELDGSWRGPTEAVSAWQKAEMDAGTSTSVTAVDAHSPELQGSGIPPPLPRRNYQDGSVAYELRGTDYVPPELSATGQIHELDSARRAR